MGELTTRAPTLPELAALGARDRWQLEARLSEVHPKLCQINDAELRRWVEVDGKTQTEIAEIVGLTQQAIGKRCGRLGIRSLSTRGRPRGITTGGNSDEPAELVEGEVVSGRRKPMTYDLSTVRGQQVAAKAKERLERAVGNCHALVRAADDFRVQEATSIADADDIAGWVEVFTETRTALSRLLRRIKETQ